MDGFIQNLCGVETRGCEAANLILHSFIQNLCGVETTLYRGTIQKGGTLVYTEPLWCGNLTDGLVGLVAALFIQNLCGVETSDQPLSFSPFI